MKGAGDGRKEKDEEKKDKATALEGEVIRILMKKGMCRKWWRPEGKVQEETREEQQIGRKGRYKDKSKDSFFFLT